VSSASIPYINLALVFNLACRHLSDGYQLLIWHRLEVESAALLVDRAIRRLVFLLLLCQLSILIKTWFNEHAFATAFIAGLFCVTLALFCRYLASETIRPDIFDLDEQKDTLRPQVVLSWWNKYRHPLVAEAEENIKSVQAHERRLGSPVLYGKHKTSVALSVINAFRGSRLRDRPCHFSFLPKNKPNYKKLTDQEDGLELGKNPFDGDSPRHPSASDRLAQKVQSMLGDATQPRPRVSEPTPVFGSLLADQPSDLRPKFASPLQTGAFRRDASPLQAGAFRTDASQLQVRRKPRNFFDPTPQRPKQQSDQ
jgi:hypothetical protein